MLAGDSVLFLEIRLADPFLLFAFRAEMSGHHGREALLLPPIEEFPDAIAERVRNLVVPVAQYDHLYLLGHIITRNYNFCNNQKAP
jgi:hypothetical protein